MLKMFEASPITRALCVAAQFGMTPFLALTYAIIRVRCIDSLATLKRRPSDGQASAASPARVRRDLVEHAGTTTWSKRQLPRHEAP